MKFSVLSCVAVAFALSSASPASAFLCKKPDNDFLKNTTVELLRNSEVGTGLKVEKVKIVKKSCNMFGASWTAEIPGSEIACSRRDDGKGSCKPVTSGPMETAAAAENSATFTSASTKK